MRPILATLVLLAAPIAATDAHAATREQKVVATRLKALATPGRPLEGVYKRSIKADQISVRGSLGGPRLGFDRGPVLTFTANGLERKLPGAPRTSLEVLKVSGRYLSNSIAGPQTRITRVTVMKAPRAALR